MIAMFDRLRRQEWDKSVDLVLANVKPGDAIAVLGAKQDKTMFDDLRECGCSAGTTCSTATR
jgi:hypothetical protein